MSALQRHVLRNKLPPMPPRGLGDLGVGSRKGIGRKRDYSPLAWDKYFETFKDVEISRDITFRVYCSGSTGPLLLLLHGGGYSGLTWSLFSSSIAEMVECQTAAVDLRGHGETVTSNDDDLSAETLSEDLGNIMKVMFGEDEPPPVILIGHSMGGAIAVHAVYKDLVPSAIGLIVIDVVEGTAMDALQSMQSFLRSRPSAFASLEHAIEWCVRSGQVRNVESARVSMPGQLKSCVTHKPATSEINSQQPPKQDVHMFGQFHAATAAAPAFSIPEEAEEEQEDSNDPEPSSSERRSSIKTEEQNTSNGGLFKQPSAPVSSHQYTWRIDLSKTEKFWTGWFEGLSNMFLSSSVPKLLLLAGVDRLDKELTIGQMQGKFQMQVLPQCGHAVQEDCPDKVAEAVATFMVRHKFAEPTSDFHRTFPAC